MVLFGINMSLFGLHLYHSNHHNVNVLIRGMPEINIDLLLISLIKLVVLLPKGMNILSP